MALAKNEPKLFNDPIHGSIEIPALCTRIIDTPQFQRLRGIKQLGGCSYVYPGGVHTRFDHSIGVCHLAGQVVRSLRDHQPELNITDTDILCLEIAGLCLNLGYGPFSHIFDEMVIPLLFPGEENRDFSQYKNAAYSRYMFEYMLEQNGLNYVMEAEYQLTQERREFIVDLILGQRRNDYAFLKVDGGTRKDFLFEIVTNERTGIDVDKWDLFARDCHMLGFKNNFIHQRTILLTRAIKNDKGHYEICFRDKEAISLYDMFYTRQILQRRAHQHKVVKAAEFMICDAIVTASNSESIRFRGKEEKLLSLKEVIEKRDMKAYSLLTDHIIERIRYSDQTDNDIKNANAILRRLDTRRLYVHAAEHRWIMGKKVDTIKSAIVNLCDPLKGSIKVDPINFDLGSIDKSPIDKLWFYNKNLKRVRVPKDKLSHLVPENFQEQLIRVYCTEPDDKEKVRNAFEKWVNTVDKGEAVLAT